MDGSHYIWFCRGTVRIADPDWNEYDTVAEVGPWHVRVTRWPGVVRMDTWAEAEAEAGADQPRGAPTPLWHGRVGDVYSVADAARAGTRGDLYARAYAATNNRGLCGIFNSADCAGPVGVAVRSGFNKGTASVHTWARSPGGPVTAVTVECRGRDAGDVDTANDSDVADDSECLSPV